MKCRKFTRGIFYFGCNMMGSNIASVIVSIVNVCMGHLDTSAWYLPLPMVSPFDIAPLFAWFVVCFFQFNVSVMYITSNFFTTTQFVSFCYYIIAMCDHFEQLIESLRSEYEQNQKGKNARNYPQMWSHIAEKLQRSVGMHVSIYE